MFDIAKIAKKIKETRIAKNMTQGDLADLMGVSYQAVSNWERGNSMPDISKLEDLCGFLGISVGELLGIENKGTAAVEKVIENKEDLSFDEIAEVAPIMPPKVLKEKTENAKKKTENFSFSSLSEIAEFLDADYLSEVIHEALSTADEALKSLDGLFNIVEYLPDEAIREAIENADEKGLDSVADCIEDIDDENIDLFAEKCLKMNRFDLILRTAEFLPDETLEKIAEYCSANEKLPELFGIAEFLPDEAYTAILKNAEAKDLSALFGFIDYFDDDSAVLFAEKCLEFDNSEIIIESADSLPDEAFDKIVDDWLSKGKFNELSHIYKYLEQHQLKKIAKAFLEKGKSENLSEVSEYL
ncbi:MAG: helix-turn-helix domain-containing protein [Oscillospiraceae bacterium]|nr:helix-turn-helix domain-containing protein [Oscillospiraceae bacterium]